MDRLEWIITIAIFIATTIGFIAGAYAFMDYDVKSFIKYKFTDKKYPQSAQEIIESCQGKNLSDSMDCIKKYTFNWYQYNLTNDKITLTFDQLKTRGGDCNDWTRYYESIAKSLGFNTTINLMFMGSNSTTNMYHTNLFVYNEEGHCLLDLNKDYPCFIYAKDSNSTG